MPQGMKTKVMNFSMQNLLMLSAQKPGPTACLELLYKTYLKSWRREKIHDWT